MKKYFLLSALLAFAMLSLAFILVEEQDYLKNKHNNFKQGEVLEYRMSYGIINVGKGRTYINNKLYRMHNKTCYKVTVEGKTSGVVDWLARVDDVWGAYVDTTALLPYMAYRNIKEGKYTKDEITRFDHKTKRISVKDINDETGKYNKPKVYVSREGVRSILSGFLFIRTLDIEKHSIGDTISVSGFFEDSFYDMKIMYKGKDKVKTKLGKINALKLVPVMPDNSLFDGDNSVTIWFSDDKNKIPLKVEADMFIGKAGVDLIGAKGLKYPINYYKK